MHTMHNVQTSTLSVCCSLWMGLSCLLGQMQVQGAGTTWKMVRLGEQYQHITDLHELLPEVGVEPPIEDRVAHARAHGDDMAETKREEVDLTEQSICLEVLNVMLTLISWMVTRPRSVMVKNRWRAREET